MTVSNLPGMTMGEVARAARTLRLLAVAAGADADDPHGREARAALDGMTRQDHHTFARGDRSRAEGVGNGSREPVRPGSNWRHPHAGDPPDERELPEHGFFRRRGLAIGCQRLEAPAWL